MTREGEATMRSKFRQAALLGLSAGLLATGPVSGQPAPEPAAVPARTAPPSDDSAFAPAPDIRLPPLPPLPPAPRLTAAEYRDGAFKAAQWAFRSEAALALDQLAARFAGGGAAVGRLESELQDLVRQQKAAERALTESLGRRGPEAAAQRSQLRTRFDQLGDRIAAKSAQIEQEFPAYSELLRPRAYGLDEIQALLRSDEALLLIATAEDATYLFAVSRDGYDWYRSPKLARSRLDAVVAGLRQGLAGDSNPVGFDRALAQELYEGLIVPAAPIIADKPVLMTVTSGALATLPLNLLPATGEGGVEWLAERHVLATLPSVSSLVAARCLLVETARRAAGCPTRLRPGTGGAPLRRAGPVLAAAGAPALIGKRVERRRGSPRIAEAAGVGLLADPDRLRALPFLDGSLEELQALKRRFGPKAPVLMKEQATEAAVKETAEFETARYVVFSTHGLLAGRAGIYGEPGLVFTPPPRGQEDQRDDGFLTASEVARMRFQAEFVVLSACNTASSSGDPGGEGLSGLARAFFFAGARSLLVSHWEVDDEATFQLMTAAFAELDRPGVSRGRAFQRAMAIVREDDRFNHPRFWAAFTLVGDPS